MVSGWDHSGLPRSGEQSRLYEGSVECHLLSRLNLEAQQVLFLWQYAGPGLWEAGSDLCTLRCTPECWLARVVTGCQYARPFRYVAAPPYARVVVNPVCSISETAGSAGSRLHLHLLLHLVKSNGTPRYHHAPNAAMRCTKGNLVRSCLSYQVIGNRFYRENDGNRRDDGATSSLVPLLGNRWMWPA